MIASLALIVAVVCSDAPAPDRSTAFTAAPSEVCGSCHPRHFREWLGSVHAQAVIPALAERGADPEVAAARAAEDPACAGCHGSLDAILGGGVPRERPVDLAHAAERVVSCTTCHQITDEHARAGLPEGRCFPEGFLRPSIETPFHRTKPMGRVRRPETCGPCHERTSPAALPIERTYSQYLASVFPERSIGCATCHFRPFTGEMVPGGPIRYGLHRHDALGVDTAFNAAPELGTQRERVASFLRPALVAIPRAPERAEADREIEIALELRNIGAGHNFPAGPVSGALGGRRMWIEILVRDDGPSAPAAGAGAEGRIVFRSGFPGPDGEPAGDPQLVELQDRFLDASGRETDSPQGAVRLEERSLRAMETRRFPFRLPATAARRGAILRAEMRVLFRAVTRAGLEKRGLLGILDRYPVLEIFRGEAGPIEVLERRVDPRVVRVPGDEKDLRKALERVPGGGEVLIDQAVTELDGPLVISKKSLTLRGVGGSSRTILRRHGDRTDARTRSILVIEGARITVSGVTVEGGGGSLVGNGVDGGGILCRDAEVILEDVVVRDSRAGEGGGIAAIDSRVTLRDSRLLRNEAASRGGGLYAIDSRLRIERSRFSGNHSKEGGAVALVRSSAEFDETAIQGNWAERGGGLAVFPSEAPVAGDGPVGGEKTPLPTSVILERSRIIGNLSRQGAGILAEGLVGLEVRSTLVAGNLAGERGGGILLRRGARALLEHATLMENVARQAGGVAGDRASGAEALARSSILWSNQPPSLAGSAEYSVVDDQRHQKGTNPVILPLFEAAEGEWIACDEPRADECVPQGPEGPTAESPAWKRFEPGDYRLILGSPAIDAGDPRSLPDPDGTRCDLGAFYRPQASRSFIRGDLDGDGKTTAADLRRAAETILRGKVFPCAAAADLDDSGTIDLLDLTLFAAMSMGEGANPRPPYPACGIDPTPDDGLGCFDSPPPCR